RGLLARRDAHLRVAELEGEVVGYAAVWIVLDQAELGDIAVAADRRGQGIGALLLRTMMDVCREQGVRDLFLEVRVSNVGARRLYERHGFRMIGRRARYYSKPKEDALVLRTRLTS
ncbi:MAG TPA: ribosomal protein S18-alanine N-acetyltransferase, partial [Longimicrobiales bacterium]|nr:ribosomal protein S18-alanine N-acetyltransferase [Longimicrobiales bacterium]